MVFFEGGHLEIVKTLISAGANPNATKGVFNTTILMLAVEGGHLEIVEALKSADAKPPAEAKS